MPRAKANEDPAVEEFTSRAGRPYRIEAFRHGGYSVFFGEKVVAVRAAQLGAFFGAPRYPSNRLQERALSDARMRIEAMLLP